jgi:hypothetical protein
LRWSIELQTDLQTNHAAQQGTDHNKAGSGTQIGEPEHTLSYRMAFANTRIIELESRCDGLDCAGHLVQGTGLACLAIFSSALSVRWLLPPYFRPWV